MKLIFPLILFLLTIGIANAQLSCSQHHSLTYDRNITLQDYSGGAMYTGLGWDGTNYYVADYYSNVVRKFDSNGINTYNASFQDVYSLFANKTNVLAGTVGVTGIISLRNLTLNNNANNTALQGFDGAISVTFNETKAIVLINTTTAKEYDKTIYGNYTFNKSITLSETKQISYGNNYFYTAINGTQAKLRVYYNNFTYSGTILNLTNFNNDTYGLTINSTNVLLLGNDKKIYIYNLSITDNCPSFNSTTYDANVTETESHIFSITYNVNSDVNTLSSYLVYNGTSYYQDSYTIGTGIITNTKTISIPLINVASTNVSFYWNTTIYYVNGSTQNNLSSQYNQSVKQIQVTNCSTGSPTLYINLLDEETNSSITGNISISNLLSISGLVSRNSTFVYTNVANVTLCILTNITLIDDAFIQYSSTNYSIRGYSFYSYISNTSQILNLYLLPSSVSYATVFFVRDGNNNPVGNSIVTIQKRFSDNTFKTVSQCKTDAILGKCTTYLRPYDRYYQEIVLQNFTVIYSGSPDIIVCIPFDTITSCPPFPVVLSISNRATALPFKIQGKISYLCNINSVVLQCTVIDTSGLMTNSTFIVWKRGALIPITECNTTSTSSVSTFTCTFDNISTQHFYEITGNFGGTILTITGVQSFGRPAPLIIWGNLGLFLAFIIIATLFYAGIHNPATALLGAGIGIIISWQIGMLPVLQSSIIGLFVVIAIVLWKMRG
jgi:hypothetical protein